MALELCMAHFYNSTPPITADFLLCSTDKGDILPLNDERAFISESTILLKVREQRTQCFIF